MSFHLQSFLPIVFFGGQEWVPSNSHCIIWQRDWPMEPMENKKPLEAHATKLKLSDIRKMIIFSERGMETLSNLFNYDG